eukprot:18314-Eustigmatos_ZCMA.PRE.1
MTTWSGSPMATSIAPSAGPCKSKHGDESSMVRQLASHHTARTAVAQRPPPTSSAVPTVAPTFTHEDSALRIS